MPKVLADWSDVAARIGAQHYGPAVLAVRVAAGFEEPAFRAPTFPYKCGDEDHGPHYRATALYRALSATVSTGPATCGTTATFP